MFEKKEEKERKEKENIIGLSRASVKSSIFLCYTIDKTHATKRSEISKHVLLFSMLLMDRLITAILPVRLDKTR